MDVLTTPSKEKTQNPSSVELKEDTLSTRQTSNSTQDLTDEELTRKWTWNDNVSPLDNGPISNPKFQIKLLLKT